MAAPTFVAEYETAWNTNPSSRTQSVTAAAGDFLVLLLAASNGGGTFAITAAGGQSWSLQQSIHISTSWSDAYVWTATAASSATFNITVTKTGGSPVWGFNVLRFSGSDGVGASSKTNVSGAAPSLALTTTGANSTVAFINADWNAVSGASRTYRSVNGSTPTEQTYIQVSGSTVTNYVAFHPDAGAAGSKTVGLTAPAGQKYSIIAVEVLGSSSSPPGAGVASAALSLSGSAVGARASAGSAVSALSLSGAAVGARASRGAASAPLSLSGVAVGSRASSGVAAGALSLSGSAAGVSARSGVAAASLSLSGSAAGVSSRAGVAAAALSLSGAAVGFAPSLFVPEGVASGALTLAGSAVGAAVMSGAAVAVLELSGAAVGVAPAPARDLRITGASVPVSAWSVSAPAGAPFVAGSLSIRDLVRSGPVAAWLAGTVSAGWETASPEVSVLSGSGPVSAWGVSSPEV